MGSGCQVVLYNKSKMYIQKSYQRILLHPKACKHQFMYLLWVLAKKFVDVIYITIASNSDKNLFGREIIARADKTTDAAEKIKRKTKSKSKIVLYIKPAILVHIRNLGVVKEVLHQFKSPFTTQSSIRGRLIWYIFFPYNNN